MRNHACVVIWILLALMQIGVCACSSSTKPINPGTGQVDLHVWRVLAPGDIPDDISNIGCRLAVNEIQDIVNQLRSNGALYGNNTNIDWDGTVQDLTNGFQQFRTQDWTILQFWIADDPGPRWRSNRINIYFTGNYTVGGASVNAATLDPAVHSPSTGFYRLIFMNDIGFSSGTKNPVNLQGWRVLEHEMAHYLARFNNRTFGPPGSPRVYNSGEHIGGLSTNNVLRDGGAGLGAPPYPLVIPGMETDTATEKGEIWARIIAGLWNSASNP